MKKLRKRKIIYYKNKKILMYSILGLFLFLGMGYSILNTSLNILGNITVKEYVEPTLYNVLKKEAETNGLAREYTGEHGDSMDPTKSTEKIYYWNGSILDKNNVIFANHCWQMIRTTDTGGVKMIYNGEAENGKCLNTRGNHVGYVSKTSQNLASQYWYGTDYTYDSINKVFSISGITEQATWNDTTSDSLIGKYTCKSDSEDGTCSKLYLVDSYYSASIAYVMVLNSDSHYSQFGKLNINEDDNSPVYVGYMYGNVYKKKTISNTKRQFFQNLKVLNFGGSSFFSSDYLYSKTISFDGTKYILDNPIFGNEIPEGNYEGYYTFKSNTITSGTNLYYLVGLYNNSYYYDLKLTPTVPLSSYNLLVSNSVVDNGDGTFSLDNDSLFSISPTEWFKNYANYSRKYTCNDATTTTCANPYFIVSSENITYYYLDVSKKILLGKERNGLTLSDTTLVRYDELATNVNYYSDYKYTCNTESAICTEDSLRIVTNYSDANGYTYVPNYYYGSNVVWDGSNYTLVDPIEIENYKDMNKLSNHHYMCFTEGSKSCQEVAYVYYYNGSGSYYYITLKNGISSISEAFDDMFDNNINNSIIKKGVEYWYKRNLIAYDNYVEDTIFCNDRKIIDYGGWNPTESTNTSNYLKFNDNNDLFCENLSDRFSISNSRAKLMYKIGLMSRPEMNLLNNSNVLKTGQSYWLISASDFDNYSHCSDIGVRGNMSLGNTDNYAGVRPAISLVPGIEYYAGDGSMENPYYVGEAYNIINNNKLFKVSKKAAPGYSISIKSKKYIVTSFKVNGNLVEGDTFTMPAEDVEITDIQCVSAYYTITNNDTDIEVPAKGRYGDSITLDGGERYLVTSFKMNATLIEGNTFTMPLEDVDITDIVKVARVIVESDHNPYPNSQNNVVYYENTFEGATSLTVELTYQTQGTSYDWVYLYDDENSTTPVNNKKYGGSTLTRETITIDSDYLKIVFKTNASGNNYYGFKAIITPNYD